MIYGSVCSGIEAATVAWHPLGWRPAWLSEIEKFPNAVLAHHYPDIPNLGDMTKIYANQTFKESEIDLLVGGTPCQSFSVAGLRKGLDDPRGNLCLEFLRLVDIKRPRWFVWENVPGVLSSSGGRDFGSFLGAIQKLGYGFAYRVLDAQYFGVPQRRRRVFVVGYLGDWRHAAAVLFERESLLGNSQKGGKKRKNIAPTISARTKGGGGLGADFDLDGGLIQTFDRQSTGEYGTGTAASTVSARDYKPASDLICFSAKDYGADAGDTAPTLRAGGHTKSHANAGVMPAICVTGDKTHTLKAEGFDASEDGTGRGQPIIAIQERAICENPDAGPDGAGFRTDGKAYTLESRSVPQAVAFTQNQSGDVLQSDNDPSMGTNQNATGRNTPKIMTRSQVRRLTPMECERLQGFPDGYTLLPLKKPADGPRYKALGNSMAVPVMHWIGRRIQMVEDILQESVK